MCNITNNNYPSNIYRLADGFLLCLFYSIQGDLRETEILREVLEHVILR